MLPRSQERGSSGDRRVRAGNSTPYRRTLYGLFWSVLKRLRERKIQDEKVAIPRQVARERSVRSLSAMFSCSAERIYSYLDDCRRDSFLVESRLQLKNLTLQGGVDGSASTFDAETMYLVVRLLGPECIVETGVLYGVFSAYILAALERNGSGRLYSIDLPFTFSVGSQGTLVPTVLRHRWSLIVGNALAELPKLVEQLRNIQMFHHDSNHNYDYMTWEYSVAWPYITSGGVLSSHDVLANPSFDHFGRRHRGEISSLFVSRNFGAARKA